MQAQWRIVLLGGLVAESGERVVQRFPTQKTAALLAYLAYHRDRTHPRDVLVDLLWPDSDPRAGRSSLSVALSALRHQLEPPGVPTGAVIMADRSTVGLRPTAATTDVSEFEALVGAASRAQGEAERTRALMRAAALYRGELLPGYYEEWVQAEKDRLRECYLDVLKQITEGLRKSGDLSLALQYAHRQVQVDPWREDGHRDLMRLLMASGRPSEALRHFQTLERLLREEVGSAPSEETRALVREIASLRAASRDDAKLTAEAISRASESEKGGQPQDGSPKASVQSAAGPRIEGLATLLMSELEQPPASAAHGEEPLREAAADHDGILEAAARQHGGQVLKRGQGTVTLAFSRATDALSAAIWAQRALLAHRWPMPLGALRARMALRTEEVQPGGPGGPRQTLTPLLLAAHAGQVLCSGETFALLRRSLDPGVRLVHLGVYRLDGLESTERLFQVVFPGMAQREFPPPRANSGHSGNLPLQFTRFFGRQEEIARLSALALDGENRLVTLTGPGGCGKTRLAIEAASRLAEAYHGAVWFVPLENLSEASGFGAALRDTLRLPSLPDQDPLEQVADALSGHPSLLLLDNLERIVEGAAGHLRFLLEEVGHLTCLVTSRQPLRISGEREFTVPPLPLPSVGDSPAQLMRCESVCLFVDRAQAVRPDFQVTAANAGAVAELCRRLEGLPLALELAAARAQVLSPSQMLSHLEDRLGFLVSRRRDLVERQRSLRATLDWSYRLLAPDLQRFLAGLAVFRGGFSLEAAEAVCDEPTALDHLMALRECSVVEVEEPEAPLSGPAEGQAPPAAAVEETELRFSIRETIRQYAWERLAEQGEVEERCRRHLHHYLTAVQKAVEAVEEPKRQARMRWLAREHENLMAALEWALEHEPASGRQLAAGMAAALASTLCGAAPGDGRFQAGG